MEEIYVGCFLSSMSVNSSWDWDGFVWWVVGLALGVRFGGA